MAALDRFDCIIIGLDLFLPLYCVYVRSEGSGDTDHMPRLITEHWLLVDAISSEILCAGPFVSE